MNIAKRFLLPKQLNANGLDSSLLNITEPALLHIATRYTREAGVRNLERAIGGVVRYKAVEWAEHLDSQSGQPSTAVSKEGEAVTKSKKAYEKVVEEHQLGKILGLHGGMAKRRSERKGGVSFMALWLWDRVKVEPFLWKLLRFLVPESSSWLAVWVKCVTLFLFHIYSDADFWILGDQGEWRIGVELGQDQCLWSLYHQLSFGGSFETSRTNRHSSTSSYWSSEERWTQCRCGNGLLASALLSFHLLDSLIVQPTNRFVHLCRY